MHRPILLALIILGYHTPGKLVKRKNLRPKPPASPQPDIVGLTSAGGSFQSNLLGAYETLDYLKEGPAIIRQVVPQARMVGLVYNPAEPQSVLALEVIRKACAEQGLSLDVTPVSSSADAVMAAQALVSKGVRAFFAMPDNTVFASFEALKMVCDQARLPVFASESGLVARGALAAYGADLYAWGRQVWGAGRTPSRKR